MVYQFSNCFKVNTQCIQIDPSIQFNSISNEKFLEHSSSLLFIDKTVDDYQTLISGVQPGIEVHILDPTQDAITQITQTLTGRSGIESLHIFSHSSAGALNFASQISTSQSPVIVVDQYSDFNGSNDTLDTYHPNNTGELKMATRWFNALKTVL